MAHAAKAAAAAGPARAELAITVLKALMARDRPAAAALLADQSMAALVLGQWETSEGTVRELLQAQWPAMQQLLIGIAGTHQQQLQQLQAAAGDITSSAVAAAVQAARQVLGEAAGEAAVGAAAAAASAVASAAAADVAPLTEDAAAAAAAAAAQTAALVPPSKQRSVHRRLNSW
jgi:hypothetical protein